MRKLAAAALAFSAAVFLANYILPEGWLIPGAVLFAVCGAALVLLRRKWLRPAAIVLLFFAAGLLEYSLYCSATLKKAEALAGETREISGVLIDYPEEYESYNRLRIRITSVDLPHFKAIVYDNEKTLANAEPGLAVRFTAKISTADTLYGKAYDNYNINGYFLKLSVRGAVEAGEQRYTLGSVPVRIRQALCSRIDEAFPQNVRPFLKALMLGEKQDFYADDALYVSMSRAGLMHIVAVSGLHIAFLVSILVFLFGNGRRGALFSIAVVWLFVLVTGSSKSAVRAAIMQTILLLAPVLRRENDPITTLSAALALILAACPLSAKSISLQLSFAAMAGIICFYERIYRVLTLGIPQKALWKPFAYILATLASSFSVMLTTFPLTALHFSYVPLLSILSNIACLWAVSYCFGLAWFACALASVPGLGKLLVWLCSLLARYILLCARLVAAIPYSVLYMKTAGAVVWMLLCFGLIVLWFLLRRKRVLRWILPTGIALLSLFLLFRHTERYYTENDTFSVLNVGQGQCITAFAGDVTAVIDCGNTGTIENAGALAGEYLYSCGRKSVEILMLTHLHEDHADGAVRLMEMIPVNTLIMPADAERDNGLYDRILNCAERHGTRIVLLEKAADFLCEGLTLHVYKYSGSGSENERCLMARLSIGETDLLVTGDVSKTLERKLAADEDLSETDILVVGHHGSRYAASEELLTEVGGRLAVISTGYNNYGHPAEETLERLQKYGYNVLRTDENGTVEIITGKNNG